MMQRFILFLAFLAGVATALAQTQAGLVKTLGRPNSPGHPLQGVTIRAQGVHNAVVSRSDGRFELGLQGLRAGDGYRLLSIRKQGYELREHDFTGRQMAFSPSVPLTIVMVSTQELQAEKLRIENNAYAAAERSYKQQMERLERQCADSAISTERYRQELLALQERFGKFQSLIDHLSDHYARIDYDSLDAQGSLVAQLIEQGRLEQADSLLSQVFSPSDLKQSQERLQRIREAEAQAQDVLDKAQADLALLLKQQNRDAEYLYHLYTIALARFDNDKARYYIETRAALDPDNADWQTDAGWYVKEYLADYESGHRYYEKALQAALSHRGPHSQEVAIAHINMGTLYTGLGQYDEALLHCRQGLAIAQELESAEIVVAHALNNMGNIAHRRSRYAEAIRYLQQVTDACRGHDDPNARALFVNALSAMGLAYQEQGLHDKSLGAQRQARDYVTAHYGDSDPMLATVLNNLGTAYAERQQADSAILCYEQALAIERKVLAARHPTTATALNNLGQILIKQADSTARSRGSACLTEALQMFTAIYGESSPRLISTYNNLGSMYLYQEAYGQALAYYRKALELSSLFYGENHNHTCTALHNMAETYALQKQWPEALSFELQSLNVCRRLFGEHSYRAASALKSVGNYHYFMGDTVQAFAAWRRSLAGFEAIKDSVDTRLERAQCCGTMAAMLMSGDHYEPAAAYYAQAASLYAALYGDSHDKAVESSTMAGICLQDNKDYEAALQTFERLVATCREARRADLGEAQYYAGYAAFKAGKLALAAQHLGDCLPYKQQHCGPQSSEYASALYLLGLSLFLDNRLEEAIPHMEQARDIYRAQGESTSVTDLETFISVGRELIANPAQRRQWIEEQRTDKP